MTQSVTDNVAAAGRAPFRQSPAPDPVAPQNLSPRFRVPLYLAGMLVAITAGHYALPESYTLAHNVLQRLYYIPIVVAAFRYGRRVGLGVALASTTLYLPHILVGWNGNPEYQVSQLLELALFVIVGWTFGMLIEEKVMNQQQLQSYERMAFFGSLSRSVIRSLRGPLRALQGIVITLERRERFDPALQSALRVVRNEIDKIACVRDDLISLVERKRLRLKRQNLNAVLFEFESQIQIGLREKGLTGRKRVHDVKLNAFLNRNALVSAMHQLVGTVVEGADPGGELTFYSGQTASYVWLGATSDQIQLPDNYPGDFTLLDYDHFRRYELISVINIMNNHFGDVRFRWHDARLVEFMLVFPRKLKLPWYLRDEPMQSPRRAAAVVAE